MTVKTILVHLANDGEADHRLATAVVLARRLDAHVTALYVTAPAQMPAAIVGRGASAAYIAEAVAIAREKADIFRGLVAEASQREGVAIEMHVVDGEPIDVIKVESRFADIALVGQNAAMTLDHVISLHPMEELPLMTACPCLVLPHGRPAPASIGRRALIGWKDSHTTARALHAALPLLESADSTVLLAIGRDGGPAASAEAAATFLRRHGIQVEVRIREGDEGDAGAMLLAAAADIDADLLVMGAYGHTRWREMIFGGATAHVCRHMTLPVLQAN
ncbi:universal stress protein family protein [Stella humosa]|uniref:Universal stress protein family protein n=1 Tax=Stella humosa TaxID=94 RepID=A0A3N1MIQ0_9PROT|nr:universal stress protein [Stella humosa]ROQ01006.1 universal stress protein family protein [Stella humosa]BBK31374.1 universal stress protein A [Stella humosa]